METLAFAPPAAVSVLSVVPIFTNQDLIHDFSDQLVVDGATWHERRFMLRTAKQFLDWWQDQKRLEADRIFYIDDHCQNTDAAEWKLRESYLQYACPDRDLRHVERAYLGRFLQFLAGSSNATL